MKKTNFRKLLFSLLKKLSFFDYLTIFLGVLIIGLIGFYFFRKTEWQIVEVKVAPDDLFWSEKNPPYWLANTISKGDIQEDGLGRAIAEVLDVKTYEDKEDRKSIFLKLRLKSICNDRKKQYSFAGKPLAIGSALELEISHVYLKTIIVNIEGVQDERKWEDKIVEARLTSYSQVFPETIGIQPWKAEAVQIGDQMKDFQGRVIAEVMEKQIKPAEKITTAADGRAVLVQDPLKKDVLLKLKLNTFREGEINYFLYEYKVKVGEIIPLFLSQVNLFPEITKILQ